MRNLEVKIRQIIWAFKKSFKPTTYDFVKFIGGVYYIKSSLKGEDKWNLFEKGTDKLLYPNIKGNQLKVVHSIKRFKNVFKQHLNFQKTSWGLIDCNKPLGTRLSYLSSDNIKF